MKQEYNIRTKVLSLVLTALLLTGCGSTADNRTEEVSDADYITETAAAVSEPETAETDSERFTSRDLEQSPDLSGANYYTVSDGQDIEITEEGVYVLTGSAKEVTVTVNAADDAKVQIVLDGVSITNENFPAIYVKNADKVFVTTTDSENILSVTGTFASDGNTNTDAVIFSKDDLVLNGTGTLTINSTENGVSGKDDLKITGGTYYVTASSKAFEANDSILIRDGSFTINAGTDGFHAEDDDDNSKGTIVIEGGTYDISVKDDGIHATATIEIDGGQYTITAAEAFESTNITFNDGTFDINATDDGINAGRKSNAYECAITFNGGNFTIVMAGGDTDAVDANGNIYINDGTFNITAQSAFDYDGICEKNGGTVIVNGQTAETITNQMMGGGMRGQNQR